MKKLIATLLSIASFAAYAQTVTKTNKTVLCMEFKTLVESIGPDSDYKEVWAWMGTETGTGSKYMLTQNAQTKTWSIVEVVNQKACVIAGGDDSTFRLLGTKTSNISN